MACVRAVLLPLVVVTLQLRGLATDSHIPALRIRHKTLELGAADDAALAVNSDGGGAPPQAQQLQAGDAAKPKSVLEKLVREPQLGEQQTHGYTHLNHQLCLHGKFGPFPAGSMFLVPGRGFLVCKMMLYDSPLCSCHR